MAKDTNMPITRRRFLKTTGAAALVSGAGPAIIIPGRAQPKTLKIIRPRELLDPVNQWYVEFASTWGEQNGIQVSLETVSSGTLTRQAKEEFAAAQGHDLYQLLSPPAVYEDQVIDHREVFQECEHRYGKALDMAIRNSFNLKTNKFFTVLDAVVPIPVIYRTDLWEAVGKTPDSWDDIRFGGRQIKLLYGQSVGISFGPDLDGQSSLRALLYSFGASVQDSDNRPALKSTATLEALKFAKALYEEAMPEEVLTWNNISNNRAMLADELSLTLNPISITRTAENKQLLNEQLWVSRPPVGAAHRLAPINGDSGWVIPKFSQNMEAAQRFLIDIFGPYRELFLASKFFYFPPFPQTIPDLAQLMAKDPDATPIDKYKNLADVFDWTTNIGYPGYNNPANGEVYEKGLIPTMFATVTTGKMAPEEAMNQADQEVRKIYAKWQALGKV